MGSQSGRATGMGMGMGIATGMATGRAKLRLSRLFPADVAAPHQGVRLRSLVSRPAGPPA